MSAEKWRGIGYFLFLLSMAAIIIWFAIKGFPYKPGSDPGYYIGLVGSLFMLLLLLYPVRKRVRFMHNWLPMKYWFRVHMFLGITGPVLVVIHSTLKFGSINAIVAFVSMSTVAISGLIGRFIYTRIHHGLYGRRKTLKELKAQQAKEEEDIRTKFHFSPQLEERLHNFETMALASRKGGLRNAWHFFALVPLAWWSYRKSCRELLQALRQQKDAGVVTTSWELQRLYAYGKEFIHAHIKTVQATSQFQAYERLFSLWHTLHFPLMFLLVITAVIHVIAVHMY